MSLARPLMQVRRIYLAGAATALIAAIGSATARADVVSSQALAGRPGTALAAPHHPRPGRPTHRLKRRPVAHASSLYNQVQSGCYGRYVSLGGGGAVMVSLTTDADFGFPPGTWVRWRPWVFWSNSSGSGWWTPYSGYFGYAVTNGNATGSGTVDGFGTTIIGGTAYPGTSTTTYLGIAPRTSARSYLELIINGRSYWAPLTPQFAQWPSSLSGDGCSFA